MNKRHVVVKSERQTRPARRTAVCFLFSLSLLILAAPAVLAIPANEYHNHIRQALTALDTLAQSDETETEAAFGARDDETVKGVRALILPAETVAWNGTTITVDNAWLHSDLDKYAADATKGRYDLLRRITERLKALDERITEFEQATTGTAESKAEASRKLAEILGRPEYARQARPQNELTRLLERFAEWIKSWLPKPKPMTPGNFSFISWLAQWFVMLLALGVLVFVLRFLVTRLVRGRRPKRKSKATARIVLGERLEPDQSARDLLSEAEALARRGELRAAIRRAYIALLVELGDRKVISLAQYKTNRDYLRAMREIEPLYRNVKQLTDSFELHWYGLAQATETDWRAFRAAYEQALR